MATGVDNIMINHRMLRYPNFKINPYEDLPSISALSHPPLQVGNENIAIDGLEGSEMLTKCHEQLTSADYPTTNVMNSWPFFWVLYIPVNGFHGDHDHPLTAWCKHCSNRMRFNVDRSCAWRRHESTRKPVSSIVAAGKSTKHMEQLVAKWCRIT
jgi:hypothetical protein